jgi:hypothetical protein
MPDIPCPTLSPLGSPHQAWHKSWMLLQCLPCSYGSAETPNREVCQIHSFSYSYSSTLSHLSLSSGTDDLFVATKGPISLETDEPVLADKFCFCT